MYAFGYENENCTDRLRDSRETKPRGIATSRKCKNGCTYIERKIYYVMFIL